MKVYEVVAAEGKLGIIEGVKTWTFSYRQSIFDSVWTITISDEKGRSYSFSHFGLLNNETVIHLLKDNLMFL